ncbi:MAG: class I tRNA ligase family protein, partial [Bacteroidota bacterium]
GDQRDYDFAKKFNIPIKNIFKDIDISEEAFSGKEGTVITDSGFLSGLPYKEALQKAIEELEKIGQGEGKTNYRLRDAVFSRQRYWGEPFPVYYVEGLPQMIAKEHLPLRLPEVEKYLPTEEGEPPLGRAEKWYWNTETNQVVSPPSEESGSGHVYPLELNTMPGWAGSSWYWFRYMDADNDERFVSEEAQKYWENVDLYIGGSEHATGHLLYSRFWTKFLYDREFVTVEEPFKKLINQGMILGQSAFVYRVDYVFPYKDSSELEEDTPTASIYHVPIFISQNNQKEKDKIEKKIVELVSTNPKLKGLKETLSHGNFDSIPEISFSKIHADVSFVNISDELEIEAFKNWREEYKDAIFILENEEVYDSSPSGRPGGAFEVSREVEKMSKSKYNVVNPDEICKQYGADTLRMYEMFLGPLEQAKPWNTAGMSGVHSFLKKLWKLYHSSPSPSEGGESSFQVSNEKASGEDLKTLHKTIKKVTEDIEAFSFNTSVSTFMICVNELTAQKCDSREILEPLAVLIAPYAPHIAEELWEKLGHSGSISTAAYPVYDEKYLVESVKLYPVSFNGKMRFTMELPLDMSKEEIEKTVMADERTQKQLEGRTPKKVIIVPGKIVNIVG